MTQTAPPPPHATVSENTGGDTAILYLQRVPLPLNIHNKNKAFRLASYSINTYCFTGKVMPPIELCLQVLGSTTTYVKNA